MFNKPTFNLTMNGEKTKIINFKIRNKAKVYTITILIHYHIKILATPIKEKKETKGIQRSRDVILSLFADDLILHLELHKDFRGKLFSLINTLSKVSG
jgi:hypothetical protein